jgi:hypothetical protein
MVACEMLKRVAEVSDKVRVLLCSVVIESVDQMEWAFTFYQTTRNIAPSRKINRQQYYSTGTLGDLYSRRFEKGILSQ